MPEKIDRGKLEINVDECKGCGLCIVACPVHVIEFSKTIINKQGYHPAQYTGSGFGLPMEESSTPPLSACL